ncbi:MAG: hypothetical protein IKR81_16725 [Victivallales bacterium]|nr:hypothetical protein [Victivallales bacterium]
MGNYPPGCMIAFVRRSFDTQTVLAVETLPSFYFHAALIAVGLHLPRQKQLAARRGYLHLAVCECEA